MVMNCWEYMKCGRELGGDKTAELGVCPAAIHEHSNGLNHGNNAGRYCWNIAGTLCGGEVQGITAIKLSSCLECEFLKKVIKEEDSLTV